MKKFKFRLERVLDYRNSLKKEKERELARKNSELHTAETRLEGIISEQDNAPVFADGETTMADLMLCGQYLAYLQDALLMQRLNVLEAADAVERARDAYIEKAIESETLETLKTRKREVYREELRREERKQLDRLTVTRHRFRKMGEL